MATITVTCPDGHEMEIMDSNAEYDSVVVKCEECSAATGVESKFVAEL